MSAASWTYRCADCGHGKHLTAWAQAVVHGPLAADGELDRLDWDEVYQLHEDSIQCTRHCDGRIEMKIGNRWCAWRSCPRCGGRGTVNVGESWRRQIVPCLEPGFKPFDTPGKIEHGGWWPITVTYPATMLDRAGHEFPPGPYPSCLHCGTIAGSIRAAEMDCEPAPRAAGVTR